MERFFYIHLLNQFKLIIMKKFILIALFGLMISCSNVQNSNYEGNLEIAKEWFEVFVTEDFDALTEFYADEIEFQSAFYGGPVMNKEETLNYLKGWQDAMEDITWEAENYLPGVDPETGLPNGSVRTYGYWSGTNTASGKSFKALWYHYLTFDENGKIINGGDFGDATGLVMAVAPDQE
jgi:ketosteroid isomerase-like protein